MSALRRAVARGMDVLGCGWREESPGVFRARIPPPLRYQFGGRAEVRVAFDVETWQQDRRTELVAPGSTFLEGLERALGERSGRPVRVSGVLSSQGALGEQWGAMATVENAVLSGLHFPIGFDRTLRFVFEVEIPRLPPVVEVVAIGCRLDGRILTAAELAALDPVGAYDLEEVQGAVADLPAWPEEAISRCRGVCREELAKRLLPAVGNDLGMRAELMQRERSAMEADQHRRRRDPDEDASAVEGEHKRRIALLEARGQARLRVQERTVTMLVVGRERLRADYVRRNRTVVSVEPKLNYGRLRADQCANCGRPRSNYVLMQSSADLWCTECGRACIDPGCAGTMGRKDPGCYACASPVWCSAHLQPCGECATHTCPDHRSECSVCARPLCDRHVRAHSGTKEPLCREHAHPCAADGAIFRQEELVRCAQTGDQVCSAHRSLVDVPLGAVVRWDRVRECTSSGRHLDVAFSGVCSVDGLVYEASTLVVCPVTGLTLHPSNAVQVEGDSRILHPRAILSSTLSGMLVARDRVVRDQFVPRQLLHPSEAVCCELSGKQTARGNTVVVGCCHRTVAAPLTVKHGVSGVSLCRDHAVACADDGRFYLQDELHRCARTLVQVCAEHFAILDQPAGEGVRADRVRVCSATGLRIDQDDARQCSVDGRTYQASLLARCPLTRNWFHPTNGIRPDGDDRLLHPSAIVYSYETKQPVAQDRAVPDAFADGAALHPSEAVQCAATQEWTAAVRTILAPCCGRRVANASTAQSCLSPRRVCVLCEQMCAGHVGALLPDEARPCDITGRVWCLSHIVATDCGRHVGPDQAIQTSGGGWECMEHFRTCAPGRHVHAVADLAPCARSRQECCPEHRRKCSCHDWTLADGCYTVDPYDGSAWCPERIIHCPRCGEYAPVGEDSERCRWCCKVHNLAIDEDMKIVYHARVTPLLPWYHRVAVGVTISGTANIVYFAITTLTGAEVVYRVTRGAVELSRLNGGARG